MRIACIYIDKEDNTVNNDIIVCSQTMKETIGDVIERKLLEGLGNPSEFETARTPYHVCVSTNRMSAIGSPVKTTTKLSDELRTYAKDWTQVDKEIVRIFNSGLKNSKAILEELRKKYPDFTRTNLYYRLSCLRHKIRKT